MKFKFIKANGTLIQGRLKNLDWKRLDAYLDTIKPDEKMELIIRKEISWDTSRMRRFFEGPVCQFVADRFGDVGISRGKGDIREALKLKFLGYTEEYGIKTPMSTTSLTRPKWIEFLRAINEHCMDEFGCSLPEADETDVGD